MSFRWSVRPSDAFPALAAAYIAVIRRGVKAIADRNSVLIMAWMIENAPWTDRTAAARQTLHTEVEQMGLDMVEIILAGGVSYFVYLELANAGRFSVITPALDHWGPIVWADVQAMLR